MMSMAAANCSTYGTWLYGRKDVDGPYIFNLDGSKARTSPPKAIATLSPKKSLTTQRALSPRGSQLSNVYFSKAKAAPKPSTRV